MARVELGPAGDWHQPRTYASGAIPLGETSFYVDSRGASVPLADGRVAGIRLGDLGQGSGTQCF